MAEIVKNKNQSKYKINFDNEEKKVKKSNNSKKKKDNKSNEKDNIWTKFRIFCHGVVVEGKRVHWTNKSDMIKYSIVHYFSILLMCYLLYYNHYLRRRLLWINNGM